MRGLPHKKTQKLMELRITPACAGTTILDIIKTNRLWDHPCMCGDYHIKRRLFTVALGSPLHVRGLRIKLQDITMDAGITPACAGTTTTRTYDTALSEDHPCMCGDYHIRSNKAVKIRGSPLHVRGLREPRHKFMVLFGITPACAGTTKKIKVSDFGE